MCSLFDTFKQCWDNSTFRCVMLIVLLKTIPTSRILLGKATTKYYNSEAKKYFEHIWYALFHSTKRTQCISGCSQIIYAKTSVRVPTPVHCSECLCVHYWIMKLRFLFYKMRYRLTRVLRESKRDFTFCVNIKLAPVTVKWAGMPTQLPK